MTTHALSLNNRQFRVIRKRDGKSRSFERTSKRCTDIVAGHLSISVSRMASQRLHSASLPDWSSWKDRSPLLPVSLPSARTWPKIDGMNERETHSDSQITSENGRARNQHKWPHLIILGIKTATIGGTEFHGETQKQEVGIISQRHPRLGLFTPRKLPEAVASKTSSVGLQPTIDGSIDPPTPTNIYQQREYIGETWLPFN